MDGKVSALLEVQLGPPSAPRPGAPEAHQAAGSQYQQPDQQRRRRHRGPGRQARDAARRDAWVKRRLENQSSSQVPPPVSTLASSESAEAQSSPALVHPAEKAAINASPPASGAGPLLDPRDGPLTTPVQLLGVASHPTTGDTHSSSPGVGSAPVSAVTVVDPFATWDFF